MKDDIIQALVRALADQDREENRKPDLRGTIIGTGYEAPKVQRFKLEAGKPPTVRQIRDFQEAAKKWHSEHPDDDGTDETDEQPTGESKRKQEQEFLRSLAISTHGAPFPGPIHSDLTERYLKDSPKYQSSTLSFLHDILGKKL